MSITPGTGGKHGHDLPLPEQSDCMLYVKDDSDITSLADLAGKSVAVQNGSYAEELLQRRLCRREGFFRRHARF